MSNSTNSNRRRARAPYLAVLCALAWLAPLLPASSARAQGVDSAALIEAGVEYFRQAQYEEAIALLSTLDTLLDTQPDAERHQQTLVKFYLALSYYATGGLDETDRHLEGLYGLDVSFVPPESPPGPLVPMIEDARAQAIVARCPAEACVDATNALRSELPLPDSIDPGCPCVDDALDVAVAMAQARLASGDYCGALGLAERILSLRDDRADATAITQIARTGRQVADRVLLDEWETHFENRRYDEARGVLDRIRSGCQDAGPSAVLEDIRARYRVALDGQVQQWRAACQALDRPGRERRGVFDQARRTIALLDDGEGINSEALAATESSRCGTPPCEFVVPYPGVTQMPPWANPRPGLAGNVVVGFEIGANGRVLNPDDPEFFRITGSQPAFFGPVRDTIVDWQFEPTMVPVCTVLELRFQ